MKNFDFKQYPAFLLFSFLVYSSIVGQTIATSVVIFALALLSAYRAYLDHVTVPDVTQPLKNEIESLKNELKNTKKEFQEAIGKRDSELTSVKEDFSKISLTLNRNGYGNVSQVRF